MTFNDEQSDRIDKILAKERPFYLNIVAAFFKVFFCIYDAIIYLPIKIFADPTQILELSSKQKAVRVNPSDPDSPYRHVESLNAFKDLLIPDCHTLDAIWNRNAVQFKELPCMGTRDIISTENEMQADGRLFQKAELGAYQWQTYEEVTDQINSVSNALRLLNLKEKTHIVIFAETRAEWMISAQACFRNGYPVVTVYATLGEDAVSYAINESDATVVFTTAALLDTIKKIQPKIPVIKHIVYFDDRFNPFKEDQKKKETIKHLEKTFERCIYFDDFVTMGQKASMKCNTKVKPDDIAMIMYTSGTTGNPKGVILSHRNIIAALAGQSAVIEVNPSDVYIAYLPSAHILEVCVEIVVLSAGVRVGYSNAGTLFDRAPKIKPGTKGDTSALRPTLMAAVPAVMDRIFKAVTAEVAQGTPVFRELFRICYERKRCRYEDGYTSLIMKKFIFGKVRRLLGGKLRIILSGGAPLNVETQRFMNICFSCPVVQGYGLTETCGGATLGDPDDLSTGAVGPPLRCCEIRLREWTEANYSPSNDPPQGEIMIHGDNVSQGYYKNEEKTKEAFVEIDGKRWFLTGDIGEVRSDGAIIIIDRKKDLLKLSHGEYISLGRVETTLLSNPKVDNICVYGNSQSDYLVALVVPNEKHVTALAEEKGIETKCWKDLCANKTVVDAVLKDLQNHVKSKLNRLEIPTTILLCHEPWTPLNGLLTEALKLKRREIENRYKAEIDEMYGKK
uniref:AMP-binding domain-containing protein n=1 Tax=Rhabditophanes sp. KR3021 TaxID=114890 RepID=A0AC35U0Q6_9BILA